MISLSGNTDTSFAFKMLLFSVSTLVLLSLFIPIFCPKIMPPNADNMTIEQLEDQYMDFTGSAPTSEAVWALTGIYTPYGVDGNGNPSTSWGRTEDGWLYGQRVVNYTPYQYSGDTSGYYWDDAEPPVKHTGENGYNVRYNESNGLYYYTYSSDTENKHKEGDLYSSVVMSWDKKSDMFFTSSGKVTDGDFYYYKYSGYRYSFQPISSYVTVDADGNQIGVVPNTTSLSLIWYQYYYQSGIAGQLIITGSDSGVAYLTAAEIVSAFNTDNSTAKFIMSFNGVDMNIYIRLDPTKLSSGLTVEDCYDLGFWSIMVSSKSVNTDAYTSADYEFSPTAVFQTMIDLLTFNTADYGLTGMAGTLASLLITIPLLLALMTIGLNNYIVIIMVGIWGVLTSWSHGLFG